MWRGAEESLLAPLEVEGSPQEPLWPREGREGMVFAVEGREGELLSASASGRRCCGIVSPVPWGLFNRDPVRGSLAESDQPFAKDVPPATAARGVCVPDSPPSPMR